MWLWLPLAPKLLPRRHTEEQRAHAAERRRRAELVRSLRVTAAEQREQLNRLRAGGKDKRPTNPVKLAKFLELLPVYQETKARLQRLDA